VGLTLTFSTPYYEGLTSATSEVPYLWDVALNARPFLVDYKAGTFSYDSVPVLRQATDDRAGPSEATLSPEDLWRRGADTWHGGAGQSFYDRLDSDPARFHQSKGVNVWDRWQLSLLRDTDQKLTTTEANLELAVAGGYLYKIDGDQISYTQNVTVDSPTWTAITGEPATDAGSIASDGFNVYTAHGSDGIYLTTRGGASTASHITGTVSGFVAYVKGRLLCSNGNVLYNPTAAGALPAALFTHPNSDFAWVGAAEGPAHIYLAGFSGDKSLIYKTAVVADGTALAIPTVAGELPDGEVVSVIRGYLGYLLIGTTSGLRLAQINDDGNIVLGSPITIGQTVRCFEPQDRFVWFGWTNYDGTSTGLGRVDLSTFTQPLTPAYASDLMATAQGNVGSVVTFNDVRVFTVIGQGVFGEDTAAVASGTIDSGEITFGLPDEKVALFLAVRHDEAGTHAASLSVGGAGFSSVGTWTSSQVEMALGAATGYRFNLRLTLTDGAAEPVTRSWTMRAYPVAGSVDVIVVPLIVASAYSLSHGVEVYRDPADDLNFVRSLRQSRQPVVWQQGSVSYTVIVNDFKFQPLKSSADSRNLEGTLTLQLKVLN
jgi:hypothetical protein